MLLPYTLYVAAVDNAGNVGISSARSFKVDESTVKQYLKPLEELAR